MKKIILTIYLLTNFNINCLLRNIPSNNKDLAEPPPTIAPHKNNNEQEKRKKYKRCVCCKNIFTCFKNDLKELVYDNCIECRWECNNKEINKCCEVCGCAILSVMSACCSLCALDVILKTFGFTH